MDANHHNHAHQTRWYHPITSLRLGITHTLAKTNDIIPTLCMDTFPNRVPLSHNNAIKLGSIPDSTQHDEAREKVIPEENIRVRRWGRWSDDRIGQLLDIIPRMHDFIHLDPILRTLREDFESEEFGGRRQLFLQLWDFITFKYFSLHTSFQSNQ